MSNLILHILKIVEHLWTNNLIPSSLTVKIAFLVGKWITCFIIDIIIESSMYAQCDADDNEYLLLDALVDYYKDKKPISLREWQNSIWGRPVTCKITAG